MSTQPNTFLSPEEYLAIERQAERKSEYYNGEMFAMGASRCHVVIVGNLVFDLILQLKGKPCLVYSTDLRLRVSPNGLYTYPDVMVVCGESRFADDQEDTLLNPTVIVEVLSDTTRDYDRGRKFEHYRKIPSLRDYLTVAQHTPHVEQWTRQLENRGLLTEYAGLTESIRIESLDCVLPMSEIYDKIDWNE